MLALPSSYGNLEEYTSDLCAFITTPLIHQLTGGVHVNDAFIYNAWGSLPLEWTNWWSSWPDHRLAQRDLVNSIDEESELNPKAPRYESSVPQMRPQSLTDWLNKIRSLALPRTQRQGPEISLPDVLTARMKTKKIAEVSRAAAYIHSICVSRDITHVIDMGSGQGYLSITLAHLFPHLKILAIDGSETQMKGSQAFAASLKIPSGALTHTFHWIDGSPALGTEIENWAKGEKCILVGLHACGSLSEHMLRYFGTIPCIEALAVIGCCYNHIVPRSPNCPTGFPISSVLRENNVTLSPTALMTACQAPNNWGKREIDQTKEHEGSIFSKRRLYRAILEKMFFDKGINIDAAGRPAWGIRKGDVANFTKFAHRAMECLGINTTEIPEAELVSYEERYRNCEGQIAILWTLSVLCHKVIESVIAMDRYYYLVHDLGVQGDVFPIFDFQVSPRNLIIVADKTKSHGA